MHIEVIPRIAKTIQMGRVAVGRKCTTFRITDDAHNTILEGEMPLVRNMDHTLVEVRDGAMNVPPCDAIIMYMNGWTDDEYSRTSFRGTPGTSLRGNSDPHIVYIAHHKNQPDDSGHEYTVLGSAMVSVERAPKVDRTLADAPSHRITNIHDYAVAHALPPAYEALMLAAADATCREMEREKYPDGVDTPYSKELRVMGVSISTRNPEERTADPWPRDPEQVVQRTRSRTADDTNQATTWIQQVDSALRGCQQSLQTKHAASPTRLLLEAGLSRHAAHVIEQVLKGERRPSNTELDRQLDGIMYHAGNHRDRYAVMTALSMQKGMYPHPGHEASKEAGSKQSEEWTWRILNEGPPESGRHK